MRSDAKLVKLVHQEVYGTCTIFAMINRRGGLYVSVYNQLGQFVADCENILDAREIIDDIPLDRRADEAEYYAQFG